MNAATWLVTWAAATAPLSSGLVSEPERVSADRAGHCERPRWSRDGQHLAYRRWRDTGMEINVLWKLKDEVRVLPRGLEVPPITTTTLAAAVDVWSDLLDDDEPEAALPGQTCRQLAWGPRDQPEAFVYACNARQGYRLFAQDGTEIPASGDAAEPAWNPSGDEIAYVSRGGIYRLACRRLGTRCGWGRHRPEALVSGRGGEWVRPVWVEGGRVLVERHGSSRRSELWLLDPGGPPDAVAQPLTRTAGIDRSASVSPDGTRVAWFVRPFHREGEVASKGHQIWMQALEPNAGAVRVTDQAVLAEDGPAWTPDGRMLVYAKADPDEADPLVAIEVHELLEPGGAAKFRVLRTGTLANRDPAIMVHDGMWRLAVSAMGRDGDDLRRSWRKIYVSSLDGLRPSSPTEASDDVAAETP